MSIRLLATFGLICGSFTKGVYGQNGTYSSYFRPNSSGVLMQHGFESVLVQPYGYDGFRVRAWPFRAPRGDETSFLYDPSLEGFEGGVAHGLDYGMKSDGNHSSTIRNGNTMVKSYGPDGAANRLAFYRIETNGSESLLTGDAPPDEQIYGTGTQQDHAINKKGSSSTYPSTMQGHVIDLLNWNTHISAPLFMSNRGYGFIWNSAAEGRIEFGRGRTRITSMSTTVVDYVIVSAPLGDYDTLRQRISAATGRAPTPPEFSLGFMLRQPDRNIAGCTRF
ncbi:hypothetical protein LTR17_015750 [Elasticomyces elasticus]|nr:hypothetical protein LTR17_015750 [Elasticomyces elasticus]